MFQSSSVSRKFRNEGMNLVGDCQGAHFLIPEMEVRFRYWSYFLLILGIVTFANLLAVFV